MIEYRNLLTKSVLEIIFTTYPWIYVTVRGDERSIVTYHHHSGKSIDAFFIDYDELPKIALDDFKREIEIQKPVVVESVKKRMDEAIKNLENEINKEKLKQFVDG